MFSKIFSYYKNAKWVKWIDVVCLPIIGLGLIVIGYSFLQDHLGNNKGLFYMLAGTTYVMCGVLELISRNLSEVGKFVAKVSETLMVVAATVLIIIAWCIF